MFDIRIEYNLWMLYFSCDIQFQLVRTVVVLCSVDSWKLVAGGLRFILVNSSLRIRSGFIPTLRHLANRQAVQCFLVLFTISQRPSNRQTETSLGKKREEKQCSITIPVDEANFCIKPIPTKKCSTRWTC